MEINVDGGKIQFDEVDDVDLQMASNFTRINTLCFDVSLPQTEIRWATILDEKGLASQNGSLAAKHDQLTGPYIFIDRRLRVFGLNLLAELVLVHEMCHFKEPSHGAGFVKEFLRALQQGSWEQLVGWCVPDFRIESLDC